MTDPATLVVCPECKGECGWYEVDDNNEAQFVPCVTCSGEGEVDEVDYKAYFSERKSDEHYDFIKNQ